MSSINQVTIVGRLGNDPELNTSMSRAMCKLSIATTEHYTQNGQKQSHTTWHKVTLWGPLAETAGKYLKKGDLAGIEGKIINRSYQDQAGQTKYVTEIQANKMHMLGSKRQDQRAQASSPVPSEEVTPERVQQLKEAAQKTADIEKIPF